MNNTATAPEINNLLAILRQERRFLCAAKAIPDDSAQRVTLWTAWSKVGAYYSRPVQADRAQKYATEYPTVHAQCLAAAISAAKEQAEGAREHMLIELVGRGVEFASGNTTFPDTDPNDGFDA